MGMKATNYQSKPCATCGEEFPATGPRSKYCSKKCKPLTYQHTCAECEVDFRSKSKEQTYCSNRCYVESGGAARAGEIGGSLTRVRSGDRGFHTHAPEIIYSDDRYGMPTSWSVDHGYVSYYWADHPAAKGGRIFEHRAVMYAIHGDKIEGLQVDHIDSNKLNNHPSNLRLLSPSAHSIKTANTEGPAAFLNWCKEHRPEWVNEWKELR